MSFRLWLAIVRLGGATSPATGGRGTRRFRRRSVQDGPVALVQQAQALGIDLLLLGPLDELLLQ